jgi:DNA-binding protein HU-beta
VRRGISKKPRIPRLFPCTGKNALVYNPSTRERVDSHAELTGPPPLALASPLDIPPRSNRMNKGDFIGGVADAAELSKADAARAVDAMIDVITKALKKGDTVTLVGFGTFSVRKRAARQGRNPQTGDTIKIKASKNPAFKAGKALKDAVN